MVNIIPNLSNAYYSKSTDVSQPHYANFINLANFLPTTGLSNLYLAAECSNTAIYSVNILSFQCWIRQEQTSLGIVALYEQSFIIHYQHSTTLINLHGPSCPSYYFIELIHQHGSPKTFINRKITSILYLIHHQHLSTHINLYGP